MSDDEDFTAASSSAAPGSMTYPKQASALRKGEAVMLKGFPCRVVEMSTSKTGKHGHAKVHFVGIDIFSGKKYEDLCPSTHNMECPFVKKVDWQVTDISHDGFMSLLDETGSVQKDDLSVPEGEVGDKIRQSFEAGKTFVVTVQSACGQEMAVGLKLLDV